MEEDIPPNLSQRCLPAKTRLIAGEVLNFDFIEHNAGLNLTLRRNGSAVRLYFNCPVPILIEKGDYIEAVIYDNGSKRKIAKSIKRFNKSEGGGKKLLGVYKDPDHMNSRY